MKRLLAAVVVLVSLVGGYTLWSSMAYSWRRPAIERELARDLPPGSSMAAIDKWIETHALRRTGFLPIRPYVDEVGPGYGAVAGVGSDGPYTIVELAGLSPDNVKLVIRTEFEGVGGGLFYRTDLKVYFFLDHEGRLFKTFVRESRIGL
jgi:hypothetical protein